MKINEANELLTSTYIDWSHALANPRGIRRNSQITWDGRVSKMLKQPVMISDVIDLADNRQYTFQVAQDGSIIQIYCQYDAKGSQIKSACLAFYSVAVYNEKISPTLQRPIFGDSLAHWLRIDYDPLHAIGVLHHDCHMHLSAFPYARLVVAGVPNPKQFVEFIMALCYPQIYEKHRLNENGQYITDEHILTVNAKCVPLLDHKVFSQIAHFRMPILLEGRRR